MAIWRFSRRAIDDERKRRRTDLEELLGRTVLKGLPGVTTYQPVDTDFDFVVVSEGQGEIGQLKHLGSLPVPSDEERQRTATVAPSEEGLASETEAADDAVHKLAEHVRDVRLQAWFISHPDVDHSPPALLRADRLRRKSEGILSLWTVWMPQRVVDEEIGDYIEDMNRRLKRGEYKLVYLRLVATMFWTLLHAVGYALKAVGLRKTG